MRTFLTEYRRGGRLYGDDVQAGSWAEAEQIAQSRGRGETVVGELLAALPADGMTPDKAAAIIAALNGCGSPTIH